MNELDNIPDDFWRKAFDGAEENPPHRVWDAVESQLDDDSKARVLPLWGASLVPGLRTLTWGAGAAASVMLLLTGWWYVHTTNTPKPGNLVAANAHVNPVTPAAPVVAKASHRPVSPMTLAATTPRLASITRLHRAQSPAMGQNKPMFTLTGSRNQVASVFRRYAKASAGPLFRAGQSTSLTQFPEQSVEITQTITMSMVAISSDAGQSGQVPTQTSQSLVQTAASPLQQTRASNVAQTGIESAAEHLEASDSKAKRIKREKWASLSIMPGAFNPAVSLASAPVSVARNAVYPNSAYTNQNSAAGTIESRGSQSVAYQFSAGVQLTDRWSVETGVGYLAAQSTVESPAQVNLSNVAMLTTNDAKATSNLYVDAIRTQINKQANTHPSASNDMTPYIAGRYGSSERQTVSNDYQFVQVPVQVGYQLRPKKRLGLALIGGFLTNIFVRNTVASQVIVTPTDNIYHSLSWAASLGARFRYRPTQHWSASLAGLYQPTLGNSTTSDSPIQAHPTSAGMSFGVDYHF